MSLSEAVPKEKWDKVNKKDEMVTKESGECE